MREWFGLTVCFFILVLILGDDCRVGRKMSARIERMLDSDIVHATDGGAHD